MDNVLNDRFKISSYIDDKIVKKPRPSAGSELENERVDEASRWSEEHGIVIILPTKSIRDLEAQWIDFNNMPKHTRRVSDWKSIELFGLDNVNRYYALRSKILNSNDIQNELEAEIDKVIYAADIPVSESYIDHFTSSYLDDDSVTYTTVEVENAKKWAEESDRIIIIPTRTLAELESLWDAFNMMHHKHCRESDWMSNELFGITNLKHYEYLKRQFLNNQSAADDQDRYGHIVEHVINPDTLIQRYFRSISNSDTTSTIIECAAPKRGIYEDKIISNIVTSVMADGELGEITPNMQNSYGELPYFSPQDMIDMGVNAYLPEDNFYGVHADNTHINDTMTVKEWFEIYRATHDGFYTEMGSVSSDWINKVRTLMEGLTRIKRSGDDAAILARKQSILELGWNPDIEFTSKARQIAKECTLNRMVNENNSTKVVDLCEFRAQEIENSVLNETIDSSNLVPVYIVLTQGCTMFAKGVMKATHSVYSHVSIAFDHVLDKIYSFSICTDPKSFKDLRGGFTVKNLSQENQDGKTAVYVFFVSKSIKDKIMKMIEDLKNNIQNTRYGYKNLFTLLFNIPYNNDNSMICSQFVDRCLKIAGIDITNVDSSLVSPEMLNKKAANTKFIYKIYDGIASKYNSSRIGSIINSLMKKAVPLKESIYFRDETSYLIGIKSHLGDIDALREMHHMIGLIKNDKIRDFVESHVFGCITLHEYCIQPKTNTTSLNFINSMISKYLDVL